MLRTLFTGLILLATLSLAQAQKNPIKQFFNKYKHTEEASDINLGSLMIDLAVSFSDEDDEDIDFLRKINHVRILSLPDPTVVMTDDLMALRQGVLADNFEELMQVRDGKELVNIYLRENEEAITDVLIMVNSPDELVFVSLEGYLRWEDLQDLNIDGVDGLDKVERGPRP